MTDEQDQSRPWLIPFRKEARALLDEFRAAVRDWETGAEGLLLSFIGKLPGLAVRLSLVLAYLDWAAGDGAEPHEIGLDHFGRAAHLVEAYALPMARRAYADASLTKAERAACRLVAVIREHGWRSFTSREVLRLDLAPWRPNRHRSTRCHGGPDPPPTRPRTPPPRRRRFSAAAPC